jgi:hypothetical protein
MNVPQSENILKNSLAEERPAGSTNGADYSTLFIDAKVKESLYLKNKLEKNWIVRRICLFHGKYFTLRKKCFNCKYLITFSQSSKGGS